MTAASHAKVNLRDVEDQAVKHGFSEQQEARFPRKDLEMAATGLSYLKIKPGKREAFAHRHRTAEEVLLVLSGAGRVKLDDDVLALAPLDVVRVSPGVTRTFDAGEQGLEVVVFGAHVDGDAEMVQGFWES
jgi:mannose-6-phosphate isomerase-like protein (cupin superfamily)